MPDAHMKLLIVDDEPATRILLAQIFGQMGHSVRSAEDGFSALEQIREAMPDILLSDLHMPGMSGFELLSVVRRRLPAIYVIATSAAYSGEDVPSGIAADAFYEKATNFRTLVGLMEAAAQAKISQAQKTRDAATIWIPEIEKGASKEAYVTITCSECLRAFSQILEDSSNMIRHTECAYCDTPMRYAIVQPLDPLTSQPYQPKLAATPARQGKMEFMSDHPAESNPGIGMRA